MAAAEAVYSGTKSGSHNSNVYARRSSYSNVATSKTGPGKNVKSLRTPSNPPTGQEPTGLVRRSKEARSRQHAASLQQSVGATAK